MAGFTTKTDYAGLATVYSAALGIRDDNENASNETYIPQGQDGSFVAIEVYGADAAPVNNYGLKADLSAAADSLVLGKITTVNGSKYMLESVSIGTSAGGAPSVSATAQLVESGATDGCLYKIPAFSLAKKQHAQDIFGAFTLPQTGATLTSCNAEIKCTVGKDKIAGVIIASDPGSGYIEVTATILQTGASAPTVTATNGWTLTTPLVCTNPETAYPSYTVTARKNLTKSQAQANG